MPLATYAAIFFCACKSCFARRPVIRGVIGFLIRFSVQASFWLALFDGRSKDLDYLQMLSYVLFISAFYSLLPIGDGDSVNAVWDENVMAVSPLQPYTFPLAFHSMLIGKSVGRFITVTLPAIIVSSFFFGAPLPVDVSHGILSILQAIAGLALSHQMFFFVSLLPKARQRAPYRHTLYFQSALLVFGGTLAPLWLYPELLQSLCKFLPFRFCVIEAVFSYTGKVTGAQALLSLGATLLWAVVICLAGQILWRGLSKNMLIHGRASL